MGGLFWAICERRAERRRIAQSPGTKASDVQFAMVLGGLTGALIGATTGRLPNKFRWSAGWRTCTHTTSYLTIVAAPIPFAFYMGTKFVITEHEPAPSLELNIDSRSSMSEPASPAETIRFVQDQTGLQTMACIDDGPENVSGNDGSTTAMLGQPGGSIGDDDGGSDGSIAHSGLAGSPMRIEVNTDGPYLAVKQDDKDPEFQPLTNYGWYSENRIADLEAHIANMRAKRLQLAQEAEYVWAWLAEKEAQHLEKFPVTKKAEENDPEPSDASVESAILIRCLNHVHSDIWRQASTCDWMIADSQKRIAQEKSRTSDGKIAWRPACSEAATQSPLNSTLAFLKNAAEVQFTIKHKLAEALSGLAMDLGDPRADMNQMAMHPIKNRLATHKEIAKDIREHVEHQIEATQMREKALREAIVEAERRAGKGN